MKKFVLAFVFIAISSSAFADCSDPNLRDMKGVNDYHQLQYLKRFDLIAKVDSAAPAGFEDTFGPSDSLCRDVTATYLKHTSGTIYVMYTTHDDYCDGGNTIGIMINMDKYSNERSRLEDSVVATIGDSEFYCKQ